MTMLGAPCSPCCSCPIDSIFSLLPEIKVTLSTSGFAAGSPANGGLTRTTCIASSSGLQPSTAFVRTGIGEFYEASGEHVLTPGDIPAGFTGTTWSPPRGYVKTFPQVLGRSTSYLVNPHIGVVFLCGSDVSAFGKGNYLWAVPYCCVPIYTQTDTYTSVLPATEYALTVKGAKSYGTREGLSGYFNSAPDGSDWVASALGQGVPLDEPCSVGGTPPFSCFSDLIVYFGARPNPAATGGPSGITRWVEPGDVIGTHLVQAVALPVVRTFQYVWFSSGTRLVGEFSGGAFSFYENAFTSSTIHQRTVGVSSRFLPFVNNGVTRPDAYARLPSFIKRVSDEEVISTNRVRPLLGWPPGSGGTCETFFNGSANEEFGKNTFEVPGTPSGTGAQFSGPTLRLDIALP